MACYSSAAICGELRLPFMVLILPCRTCIFFFFLGGGGGGGGGGGYDVRLFQNSFCRLKLQITTGVQVRS